MKALKNSSKNRRTLNLFSSLATLLILFSQAACAPLEKNKRIVVASAGKIDSLDPAQANTLRALQLISALGDPLYRLGSSGSLEPRLAKDLPEISSDGLTVSIPLRENILFHDGTEFNAEAMAFSLKRFMKIGTNSYVIGGRIKKIETPDPYILRLQLSRPSSSIKGLLTSISLTPVSPNSYKDHKDTFLNKDFIGTGPYKLVSFQNEKQRLEPNPKYWGKNPSNLGIDYINFKNSTSLYSAIKTGEVDLLLSNSVEDGQRLSLHKMSLEGQLKEGIGPAMEIGYITFKSNTLPLQSKTIRKALLHSLDRNLIAEKVSYGLREPLRSIVPPLLKSNKTNYWPSYNPSLVIESLKSEGYCNDKKLTIPLTFRSNVPADKLLALTWQEQIRKDLSDCLNITLNGVESTTVYKQLSEGSYEAVILDWTGAYPDPEAYLSPLLSCKKIVGETCEEGEAVYSGSFWAQNELETTLKSSEEAVGEERKIQLNKVESLAAEGAAYLPVWLVKPRAWAQNNLSTPEFDGGGLILLDRLTKDINE